MRGFHLMDGIGFVLLTILVGRWVVVEVVSSYYYVKSELNRRKQ